MNPARKFGSAAAASFWAGLWIYFNRAGFGNAACSGTLFARKGYCLLCQVPSPQQFVLHFQLWLQPTPRPGIKMKRFLYRSNRVDPYSLQPRVRRPSQVKGVAAIGMPVSNMETVMPKGKLGSSEGALIRDLDGHAILLAEE